MTVGELIAKLRTIDASVDVLCLVEGLRGPITEQTLLDVVDCSVVEASKGRLEDVDRTPILRYGKSTFSQRHCLLSVTSDF